MCMLCVVHRALEGGIAAVAVLLALLPCPQGVIIGILSAHSHFAGRQAARARDNDPRACVSCAHAGGDAIYD